jgi:hypothetical protein
MNNIRNRPDTAEVMLDRMRENLSRAASRVIHNTRTDKYTSINVKNGYIEFRSPGGDWLDTNFNKIQQTLERFVVALDAAVDPEKYRQEYLKKLHRALSGTEIEHNKDPVTGKKTFKVTTKTEFANLLAEYMAGKINREDLSRIVGYATAQRQVSKNKPAIKQEYRMVNPVTDEEYTKFTADSIEKADAKAKLYAAEHDIDWSDYIVLDSNMQVVGGDLRHTATPGRHSDPNGRYEIMNRATGAPAQPVFRFSVAPQQIPYVLQAWAARNGTTPSDWWVKDTEFGIEVASSRPSDASATGIDPLWTVSLRANMARNVEVRAPSELSALAAAHEADPANFPMSLTTDDVIITSRAQQLPTPRPIPGVEDIPLDIDQNFLPGSTQDLQQRRAAAAQSQVNNGQVVDWKIVSIPADGDPQILHILRGIGSNQGDANRASATWLLANREEIADQIRGSEIAVLPIRVPTGQSNSLEEAVANYRLWTAPVKIKQPNYSGYIDVTVTAQNAHLAKQLMKAQYGVPDWHVGSVKEVKV